MELNIAHFANVSILIRIIIKATGEWSSVCGTHALPSHVWLGLEAQSYLILRDTRMQSHDGARGGDGLVASCSGGIVDCQTKVNLLFSYRCASGGCGFISGNMHTTQEAFNFQLAIDKIRRSE